MLVNCTTVMGSPDGGCESVPDIVAVIPDPSALGVGRPSSYWIYGMVMVRARVAMAVGSWSIWKISAPEGAVEDCGALAEGEALP
jgi:hypothetical protein